MTERKIDALLCDALAHLERGDQYKLHLYRLLRECLDRLFDGDRAAPTDCLKGLNLPGFAADHLPPTFVSLEAATWVRAAAQFLKIAEEAAQHHAGFYTFSQLEVAALEILRDSDPKPLRVGEIVRRLDKPPRLELQYALTRFRERSWVVMLTVEGPDGDSFRLAPLGHRAIRYIQRVRATPATATRLSGR